MRHQSPETTSIHVRRAAAADAPRLTEIAFAAKRHWNYPEEWIQMWRSELTLTPGYVETTEVWCAETGGFPVGVIACGGTGEEREIDHLWVAPEWMGRGVGSRLFEHLVASLRAQRVRRLRIVADPHAIEFYLRAGAEHVGWEPSTPEGRRLPLMVVRLDAREQDESAKEPP